MHMSKYSTFWEDSQLSFQFEWSYCSDKQQVTYVLEGTSTFYFWDWLDKQNTLTCLRRINYGLYAHVNYELRAHEQKSNLLERLTVKFPLWMKLLFR